MNNEQLRELLVEKYDYKNSQVDGIVEKINSFSPNVATAFNKWVTTNEIDNTEVESYTIKDIIAKQDMKIVSAYITLDWLSKDPIAAKKALNRKQFEKR